MMSLSSYLKYEEKVTNLLIEKLNSEQGAPKKIRANYDFKKDGQSYVFDLVEFDEEDRLQKIYEIKTFSSVKSNSNFIKSLLHKFESITLANAYLAYLDEEKQLHVIALSDFEKATRKTNTIERVVQSFSEYYETLKELFGKMIRNYSTFLEDILMKSIKQFQVFFEMILLNTRTGCIMRQYERTQTSFLKT